MFTAEFDSERIVKIGQYLPKLWAIKYRVVFLMKHRVDMDDMVDMTFASCHSYQIAVHATVLYGCTRRSTSKQSETVKPTTRFIL